MSIALTRLRSSRTKFWILAGCFVLASLVLLLIAWDSRYSLTNVDGISYISIARQYSIGSTSTALNAYWSPLISWLLAPLIGLGVDGQFAFVIVNAIAAILGMGFATALAWYYGGKHFSATGIFLGMYMLFAATAIAVSTPDLLVATWVVVFVFVLATISARMHTNSTRQRIVAGVVLGVICTIGYFTKLFLVPVFIVVLLIWLAIRALDARRLADAAITLPRAARPALATLGIAAAVLIVLAAPWVASISVKYHQFTVGSSFAVNVDKKFDPSAATAKGDALTLWAPPNSQAVSFGEDRTQQVATSHSASHISITSRIWYYVDQRLEAFPAYVAKIGTIAPFAIAIILLFALALAFRLLSYRQNRLALYATVVWGVYFIGYAAITTATSGGGNSRYYWPLYVLSNLVALLLVSTLWKRLGKGGWQKLLIVCLVAALPLGALFEFGIGRATPFSIGPPPTGIAQIVRTGAVKSAEQQIVESDLSKVIPKGSRIVGTDYRQSLKFAYYLQAHIFGRADQGYDPTDPLFQKVLRANHIDYLLLFTQEPAKPVSIPSLGTVVQSTSHTLTCSDDTSLLTTPCNIEVIKISY